MTPQPPRERILVVERDSAGRETRVQALAGRGYDASGCEAIADALEVLDARGADLVILDVGAPGGGAEAALDSVRSLCPEVPVIVTRADGSVADALRLTRSGAADYLVQPVRTRALLAAVGRVLAETLPVRTRARDRRQGSHLTGIIGRSQPMQRLFERIDRIGPSSAPVLIAGETGSGKEPVALAVHRRSGRGRFVPVNCGAIPNQLLESELFGHARGAFTGADRDKPGLFEEADGGTLFLDEIAELPLHLQPKLLRVLESGELRRLGDVTERVVSVRLIAATHRDLEERVRSGAFRQDLFWRINVLHLEVPPLRERASDIPLLVDAFVAEVASREGVRPPRVDRAALAALVAYGWPGNVRELRNLVERAVLLCDGGEIGLRVLPDEVRGAERRAGPAYEAAERGLTLGELERAYVEEVLRRTGGNRSRAAELLGMPRRTLYRRLDEYGSEKRV